MAINTNEFLGAIDNIAKRNIAATPIDLTIEAAIALSKNVEIGEYLVTYQGNTFTAYAADPTVIYKKRDVCYVLVPQGDFSRKKIILGLAKKEDNISQSDQQKMTNYYLTHGPNLLELYWRDDQPEELGICAVPEEDKYKLVHPPANWQDVAFYRTPLKDPVFEARYPHTFFEEPELDDLDEEVQDYSANFGYLSVFADFKTSFHNQHVTGNYGLRVELIVDNPRFLPEDHINYSASEPRYQIVTLELDINSFTGAPYQFSSYTRQEAHFAIDKGSIKGLAGVALYQDGKFKSDMAASYTQDGLITFQPENSIYNDNNIFCTNIGIWFSEKVVLTDTLYKMWIETPHGTNLFEESPISGRFGVLSILLKARLLFGRQDIMDKATCKVLWFKENAARVYKNIEDERDEHNKTHYDYSGPGWEYISETEFDELEIKIDEVIWQRRYKAVVVYNGTIILADVKNVVRKDSKYDLTIEQFVSENGKQMLRIRNRYDTVLSQKYAELENFTGTGEAADAERQRIQNEINNILAHKNLDTVNREWFGTWWLNLQDGSHRKITADYHLGPIEIDEFLINNVATFKVQAYDPYNTDPNELGLAAIQTEEIGTLTTQIVAAEVEDLLVEWIGRDTFTYDALGNVKPWVGKQEQTLQAKLLWKEGKGTDYFIEFVAPDGKILSSVDHFNKGNLKGYSPENSLIENAWVDEFNVIHFNIAEKYDIHKTNNTFGIKLRTIVKNRVFHLEKEIKFFKDGDQGTQGSDWTAPIRPCSYVSGEGYPPPFTDDLGHPMPLIVQEQSGVRKSILDHRLFLRPFVSKNGVRIEQMSPEENYSYQVFWDVRYPQNIAFGKNSSFLRLYQQESVKFEHNPSTKTAPDKAPGLTGITQYSGLPEQRYAAIEVRYDDTDNKALGITPGSVHYNFEVWAQIDIKKDGELVSSINSSWPVDIFFDESKVGLDPKNIKTNWPQYVEYNATGYDPAVFQDRLEFLYGENALKGIGTFAKPETLTPDLQVITEDVFYGEDEVAEVVGYRYKPTPYYFWQNGYNGALRTSPGEIPEWGDGYYVRNQIFTLNNYGNVDINGWDGRGISINEDEGTLFAPTIGAGYKDPLTNTFTGVIMGIDSSQLKTGAANKTMTIQNANDWITRGNRLNYNQEAVDKQQYMTGLYGYQEGVSSFGIMENGTAFFGRADRGARILLDGVNGTIYGGGNGVAGSPKIGDPMWNTMRISLIDLAHATKAQIGNNETNMVSGTAVDGVMQGFEGDYFRASSGTINTTTDLPYWYQHIWKKGTGANSAWEGPYVSLPGQTPYWLERVGKQGMKPDDYWSDPNNYNDYKPNLYNINYWDTKNNPTSNGQGDLDEGQGVSEDGSRFTFGPNRASTTPAIEVGQHPKGLKPGLIPWGKAEEIFKNFWIPGDRNFLVTYDGTLWAMNANIMGNIIGSNIVGGRIQGVEIRIGDKFKVDKDGNMFASNAYFTGDIKASNIYARSTIKLGTLGEYFPGRYTFEVDADGNMWAANAMFKGTITASHMDSTTITTSYMSASTITTTDMSASTITTSHMDASTIDTSTLTAVTIKTSKMETSEIESTDFYGGTLSLGDNPRTNPQFHVSKQGHLTANSATIHGKITATEISFPVAGNNQGNVMDGQLDGLTGRPRLDITATSLTTHATGGHKINIQQNCIKFMDSNNLVKMSLCMGGDGNSTPYIIMGAGDGSGGDILNLIKRQGETVMVHTGTGTNNTAVKLNRDGTGKLEGKWSILHDLTIKSKVLIEGDVEIKGKVKFTTAATNQEGIYARFA